MFWKTEDPKNIFWMFFAFSNTPETPPLDENGRLDLGRNLVGDGAVETFAKLMPFVKEGGLDETFGEPKIGPCFNEQFWVEYHFSIEVDDHLSCTVLFLDLMTI